MKTCGKCRKDFDAGLSACPHCGEPGPGPQGVFQTSTVLISSGGADLVYRSVSEVPAALRNKLLKSTNGQNAATILIADRRGRQEVAKAVQSIPGSAQKRLVRSRRAAVRRAIPMALGILALAAAAAAFLFRWR